LRKAAGPHPNPSPEGEGLSAFIATFLGSPIPRLPTPWAATSFRFKFLTETPRFANWHGF
ncbi:MAG TPA: hypothetical protein VN047_00960, partial [Sphingopyxis sp.]|nr:hypothetical protein [Sphingopyxis sp.]